MKGFAGQGVYEWGDCSVPLVPTQQKIEKIQYIVENFDREQAIGAFADEIPGADPAVLDLLKKVDAKRIFNHLLT